MMQCMNCLMTIRWLVPEENGAEGCLKVGKKLNQKMKMGQHLFSPLGEESVGKRNKKYYLTGTRD